MTWYEFLLFVHIACAVIWLGGAFFVQLYAIAVQRGGDSAEMAFAGRVGTISQRVFIPASLVVPARSCSRPTAKRIEAVGPSDARGSG